MEPHRNGKERSTIRIGVSVDIIRKADQRSNKRTRGIVEEILTSSISHPHGIKVRLKGGEVGRVIEIFSFDDTRDTDKQAR
jgi:uncharacterized repeat protein (TIGR03833 family)